MSRKKPSSLGCVVEASLAEQSKNKIMEASQHSGAMPNGEAGRIFLESNIPTIM
jgi:hypothetical protein